MTLDLSTLKPNTICISRDGREWEYIGKQTTGHPDCPHVFYKVDNGISFFTPHGEFATGLTHNNDIISIKPEERVLEGWVNIFSNGLVSLSLNEKTANYFATANRIACKHIKITYFEGEGL